MRDCIEIGPAPCNEPCAQIGDEDYRERAIPECRRFIELIRAVCGPEPDGASLRVKSCSHDFGTYYEVAVSFDDDDRDAIDYAFHVEANAPMNWDTPPRKTDDELRRDMAARYPALFGAA